MMNVLVVDDNPSVLAMARAAARGLDGVDVTAAATAAEAFDVLGAGRIDLVLLDLGLPDRPGPALLSDVLTASGGALVSVVGAGGKPELIVDCVKRGAFDYVARPLSPSRLLDILQHARSITRMRVDARPPAGQESEGTRNGAFARILTRSPLMLGLFKATERVATSPFAVLLQGESGVGKDLISRAIHDLSRRCGAFVPVNVAGLDDALFSDTLFGHRRGAYTGAQASRRGLVCAAEGGTLFLDEIGDIGPESQAKLLRFLQDGEFYPLGADEPERSTARLVLATNVDLLARMRAGAFREDLYYRLKIHSLAVPPLRQRREDIPLLVREFVADAARATGRPAPHRLEAFIQAVAGWSFPGNVRELFSLVNGAMVWAEEGELPARYAMEHIRAIQGELPPAQCVESPAADGSFPTLEQVTDRHVREALRRCGGNQSAAARLLGISQSTISRKLGRASTQNA
jgi:DNA-binding NtrC family response regulator